MSLMSLTSPYNKIDKSRACTNITAKTKKVYKTHVTAKANCCFDIFEVYKHGQLRKSGKIFRRHQVFRQ